MPDSIELMLGRIDGKTELILKDIQEIKASQADLSGKVNKLRSEVDILQTEHNDRKNAGVTCSPVNVYTASMTQLLTTPKVILGAVVGVGILLFIEGGAVFALGKGLKWW